MEPLQYHRSLKVGTVGFDVWGAKRAVYIFLKNEAKWQNFLKKTPLGKRTFGTIFRADLIKAQRLLTAGVEGVFDKPTLRALESVDAFDHTARALWNLQYVPIEPKLVEPIQGFHSLDKSLWELYSIGRDMDLSDEGTYNAASKLPSGAPSDHAFWPAFAFDLGIHASDGYANPTGRKYFDLAIKRTEVHYVILGTTIWSKEKGLHGYTDGGHTSHCHTSGIH